MTIYMASVLKSGARGKNRKKTCYRPINSLLLSADSASVYIKVTGCLVSDDFGFGTKELIDPFNGVPAESVSDKCS